MSESASINGILLQQAMMGKDVEALQKEAASHGQELYGNGHPGIVSRLQTVEEQTKIHKEFIEELRSTFFKFAVKVAVVAAGFGIAAGAAGSFVTKMLLEQPQTVVVKNDR